MAGEQRKQKVASCEQNEIRDKTGKKKHTLRIIIADKREKVHIHYFPPIFRFFEIKIWDKFPKLPASHHT